MLGRKKARGLTGRKALARKFLAEGEKISRSHRAAKGLAIGGAAMGGIGADFGALALAVPAAGILGVNAIKEAAIKRRLARHPRAARMLATEFRGTEYGPFFERVAAMAESRAARGKMRRYFALRREKK